MVSRLGHGYGDLALVESESSESPPYSCINNIFINLFAKSIESNESNITF